MIYIREEPEQDDIVLYPEEKRCEADEGIDGNHEKKPDDV
jgi:hypothetical protein